MNKTLIAVALTSALALSGCMGSGYGRGPIVDLNQNRQVYQQPVYSTPPATTYQPAPTTVYQQPAQTQYQQVNPTTQYQADLYECQQYANQVSPVGDAAIGGLGGAAGGAALGAITGAILPGVKTGRAAALGGALGGVLGLGAGAYSGISEQDEVMRRCLQGRGYNVLN